MNIIDLEELSVNVRTKKVTATHGEESFLDFSFVCGCRFLNHICCCGIWFKIPL